ncbi:MAG TPA: hypothetical protein VMF30_02770 [Pirellulales bacterium]|nr:hypothetical protein [Pirellulales bacterium]
MRSRPPARHRIVVLGASNVARGISVIAETARQIHGRPLEIFAAFGRGRSFGKTSSFLGHQLPGIVESGLWQSLSAQAHLPTSALVTDIGNDLFYDQPLDRIVGWIDFCLARLAALEARTVVTRLPLDNLPGLGERRFRLLRKIFFPNCRQSLAEVTESARALDARVAELARAYGAEMISPPRAWYGFDAIHIRLRAVPRAWREILLAWSPATAPARGVAPSPLRALYLNTVFPERQRVFGRAWQVRQPSGKLPDGTTMWFY